MISTLCFGAALMTSMVQSGLTAPPSVVAKLYVLSKGDVTFAAPTKGERPARLMVELEEGTTVTVGSNAKPRITFLRTGTRLQLSPNSKVKVSGDRLVVIKGAKPTDLPKIPVRVAQHGSGATVSRPAATLARGDKLEISLVGGFRSVPEYLRWREVEGAASYRVSITQAGQRISSIFYSDGPIALMKTKQFAIVAGINYELSVEALNQEGATIKIGSTFFRILTPEEVKDLNMLESQGGLLNLDDPNELLVLADLYEEFMLDSEALSTYRKLSTVKPRSEEIDSVINRLEKAVLPPQVRDRAKPDGARSGYSG